MNLTPLLALIRKHEAAGSYDAVWGGIKAADRPTKPLTSMTIGEVLAWQDAINPRYRSEAAGAYQIMRVNLRALAADRRMNLKSLFNAATQDDLAVVLLMRRGLHEYLNGDLSAEDFCNHIAHEWASLPLVSGPRKGRGVYDGDGLNKAAHDVDAFLQAVKDIKDTPATAVPFMAAAADTVPDRTHPAQSTTVQASAVQLASGAGAGIAAVSALSGTAQIVALAFVGIVILTGLWIMRERLRKWADGVR